MKDNTTILIDDHGKTRDFTYDYCFWSVDGYEENEEGLYTATYPRYHDQDYVYNKVGKEILDNAINGYHSCLFAYGQTSAGKSYSMLGNIL